jgi:hypothetical protein
MNKKTTFSKKSKKEHTKVSHKKVHKKKKTSKTKNENKNINKNIITINGTGGGSSGSSGSSSVIPIPYSMSTPVAPAQPIHIFNEPPMERFLPIKQEPLDIKQEIPLPVHQDTPVKLPVKSPFDEIESKVDSSLKNDIENDIKKRHRVFIEPKTTPVSVNQSDLSNSFFSKKIEDNNNDLSKLIPFNVSSTPIITETYDIDQNEKWFNNPLKFYDTDTSISSNSSLTNKSNKSTANKSTANKSTANKSTENKSIENNENPNRDIEEYNRRLEQNIIGIPIVKPKRYRRTKEQMVAFRAEQAKIKAEKERVRQEKLADFERKAKIFFDKYG